MSTPVARRPERATTTRSTAPRGFSAVLRGVLPLVALVPLLATFDSAAVAQHTKVLAIRAGEELEYRLRIPGFGTIGRGTMSVSNGEEVRGTEAYLLRFDLRGRVGFAIIEDQTRSWIDPRSMALLRFEKRERSPLSSSREEVDVFPADRRWVASTGEKGNSPTATSLDELSFLYHIRALPLENGDTYSCDLHFDADRNPVNIRVLGRGTTRVPAGEFSTITVEMRVRDNRRYGGEGVIKLHITDDERRIPVRIESPFPVVGNTSLELESL
jgi:hypothetical protein